jgi:hypothetical protein
MKKNIKVFAITFFMTISAIGFIVVWIFNESVKNEQARLEYEIKKRMGEEMLSLELSILQRETNLERRILKDSLEKASSVIYEYEKLVDEEKIKLRELDKVIRFENLMEELRSNYGEVEAGVRYVDDHRYMKKFREYERSYKFAIVLANQLGKYDDYNDFFKELNGLFNSSIGGIIVTEEK